MTRVVFFALIGALLAVAACSEVRDVPLFDPADIVSDALPISLTGQAGRIDQGRVEFISRETGHCILCHAITGLDAEFQGNAGPDLTTVGDRLSLGQIRLRVVDYQLISPGALMPSYYRNHNLYQVSDEYRGASILTAQQVEDIAAFLAAQQSQPNDD